MSYEDNLRNILHLFNRSLRDIVPPPLFTYQRQAQITLSSLLEHTHDSDPPSPDSHTMDPSSSSPSPNFDHVWPIALRKSIQSTRNTYPVYNFLGYHYLSSSYTSFVYGAEFEILLLTHCIALHHDLYYSYNQLVNSPVTTKLTYNTT